MDKQRKIILYKFIKFVKDDLGIKTPFKIRLSVKREDFKTSAYYNDKEKLVAVYVKGRKLFDVCRSIAHELQHCKDHEIGLIKGNEPDIGDFNNPKDIENRANSMAGILVKKFGYMMKEENIDFFDL